MTSVTAGLHAEGAGLVEHHNIDPSSSFKGGSAFDENMITVRVAKAIEKMNASNKEEAFSGI